MSAQTEWGQGFDLYRDPAVGRLLRDAIERAGCGERQPTLRLAHVLQRRADQRALLEAQVAACPDVPAFKNALAWLLATASEPALRDGPRAVRLARKAVAETGESHAGYIETLAAAVAETGDSESALVEQRRALAMIEGRDVPPGVLATYRRHLASLEAGRPVREP
jgi:hypothetical protein